MVKGVVIGAVFAALVVENPSVWQAFDITRWRDIYFWRSIAIITGYLMDK
jgi:hypothetical protein